MGNFDEAVRELSKRVADYREKLATEAATKTALILPFISQVLGYDIFDPHEVIPEFVADIGLKRGEKIDYAILRNGKVEILIEAKNITSPLRRLHASQLVRYFSTQDARIGILTNGHMWEFYTDLTKANIMDEQPFMVLDLLDPKPSVMTEIQKLSKDAFDLDSLVQTAQEFLYLAALKEEFRKELAEPSPDYVKVFARKVFQGNMGKKNLDMFTDLMRRVNDSVVSEKVSSRLENALRDVQTGTTVEIKEAVPAPPKTPELDSTYQQALYITKALVSKHVSPERITLVACKGGFIVCLDGDEEKALCNLSLGKTLNVEVLTDPKVVKNLASAEELCYLVKDLRSVVQELEGQTVEPCEPEPVSPVELLAPVVEEVATVVVNPFAKFLKS